MRITEILNQKYGIDVKAGQKCVCPFCRHKTFSIKSDNSIGKCFHPSCGRLILPSFNLSKSQDYAIGFLHHLFILFHSALIDRQDDTSIQAYKYLTDERKIHPEVIADSMIGVIPFGFNLYVAIEEYKREVISEKIDKEYGNGIDSENNSKRISKFSSDIAKIQEKLSNCLMNSEGWLCFFYTDSKHKIKSIRFRRPFSKDIKYFKPGPCAGVFGLQLFSDLPGHDEDFAAPPLIITEGEFNQLQLQSLCLRRSKLLHHGISYVNACAIGGVSNADFDTIAQITSLPVICYDNDSSQAGFRLVESAQKHLHLEAFTTPGKDTDLDDFLRSFENNHEKAWKALKEILNSKKPYFMSYEPSREKIQQIRKERKKKPFEINQEVSAAVISDLSCRGSFYNDGNFGYFFSRSDKSLLKIEERNLDISQILSNYGINPSEIIYKYIIDELKLCAFNKGQKKKVYRLSYYDSDSFTLYLSNHQNGIYRITDSEIKLTDNGEDGILFLKSEAETFEIHDSDDIFSQVYENLLFNINLDKDNFGNCERKLILYIWFLSIFFIDIMPTRPILALIGEKGSGKSTLAREFGLILFGSGFDVFPLPSDVRDFEAIITNSAFIAFDNADSKSAWLNDRLASAATGAKISKRELYTTNDSTEYRIRSNLALTARTPVFTRDDVADRLLLMKLRRIEDFQSESFLSTRILKNRDFILSEVLSHLQSVVYALKEYKDYIYKGPFRMADFASFAMKIAMYNGIENRVESILKKLSQTQTNFTLENDPIFELLHIWIMKKDNEGKEISSSELFKSLAELAKEEDMHFPYEKNVWGFGRRLKNMLTDLSVYFRIKKKERGGRIKYYTFWRKSISETKARNVD